MMTNQPSQNIPDLIIPSDLDPTILKDVQFICSKMFSMKPHVEQSYTHLFAEHEEKVKQFNIVSTIKDFSWLSKIKIITKASQTPNPVLLTFQQEQNERHLVRFTNGPKKHITFTKGKILFYTSFISINSY